MLEIKKMIVHVLDCEHNILLFSDNVLEDLDEQVNKIVVSKIMKAFQSNMLKDAYFHVTSKFKQYIQNYKNENISFVDFCKAVTQLYFDAKMNYAQYHASDLWCIEVLYEDRRYLVMIENTYQEALTHHIVNYEKGVTNEIIQHKTLLSSLFRKKDQAIIVELYDESVKVIENKIECDGKGKNFISDFIIDAGSVPSYKESISTIESLSKEMSEKYQIDEVKLLPKMKKMIVDSIDSNTKINIEQMADTLFDDYPLAKSDFKDEIRKKGIEKEIKVENKKVTKSNKLQKITTDTGIEISFPIDYIDSKDMIEFKNNPDGTIVIQLKNINKILSK